MMDNHNNYSQNNNWRKQKENNIRRFNQMGNCSRPRSHNNRRSSFGWQPSSWEKKFCANAGVPWQKVLETKKYMYQDDKVLQWNDSAVKEAFLNAKERFRAKIHGQPCDIKLPDPNIFIDEINWESHSNVDPELIMDLEKREPDVPCESEKRDGGVVVGIPVVQEQYLVAPTGWGDVAEEGDPQQKTCEPHDDVIGYDHWGDDNDVIKGSNAFSREQKGGYVFVTRDGAHGYDHWDDNEVNKSRKAFSRDQREGGYVFVTRNGASGGENRGNGSAWYRNKKGWDHGYNKRWDHGDGDGGWNTSRSKISRFHHNGNDQSLVHDYGNTRGNYDYERPLIKSRPATRRW